jgi:hypothetical protein
MADNNYKLQLQNCQEKSHNNYPGNVLDLTTGYDEGRTRAGISDSLPSSAVKVNPAHQDTPPGVYIPIQEVKHIWGDYLMLYDWDYFITLTFARTCYNPTRALYRAKQWSKKWYFQRAIFFIEDFAWSDGVHVHGLVKCNEGLKPPASELWNNWFKKWGRNTISIYQKDKGAEHYLTKYITKDIKKNDYLMWGRAKWWKHSLYRSAI